MTGETAYDDLIAWDEGAERVRRLREAWLPRLGRETVPLDRIAGRTVAEPIHAPADVPAHSYATMDGFAFDATDTYPLDLVDIEVFPEDEPPTLAPGEAARIATGAPSPRVAPVQGFK
jgi:molybdopterin molybdotransferase